MKNHQSKKKVKSPFNLPLFPGDPGDHFLHPSFGTAEPPLGASQAARVLHRAGLVRWLLRGTGQRPEPGRRCGMMMWDMDNIYIYVYIYVYIYMYIYMYIYIYIFKYIYIYIYTYLITYISLYVYIYIIKYVYMYIYIYIRI